MCLAIASCGQNPMKTSTQLRIVGGIALLGMIYAIGKFGLAGPWVAVVVFGFAAGYEWLVVGPAKKREVADIAATPSITTNVRPLRVEAGDTPASISPTTIVEKIRPEVMPTVSTSSRVDEDHWAEALAEFDGQQRRAGLWAKLFATHEGDEVKAKVDYLKTRVGQIASEATSKQALEDSERAKEEKGALIAQLRRDFIAGLCTPDQVSLLAQHSAIDPSLSDLRDRLRGDSLLHLCARYGFAEEAKTLLLNGADPNAGNGSGLKPQALALPGSSIWILLASPDV